MRGRPHNGAIEDAADQFLKEHDPHFTDKTKHKSRKSEYPYLTPEQLHKKKQREIPMSNLLKAQERQCADESCDLTNYREGSDND